MPDNIMDRWRPENAPAHHCDACGERTEAMGCGYYWCAACCIHFNTEPNLKNVLVMSTTGGGRPAMILLGLPYIEKVQTPGPSTPATRPAAPAPAIGQPPEPPAPVWISASEAVQIAEKLDRPVPLDRISKEAKRKSFESREPKPGRRVKLEVELGDLIRWLWNSVPENSL